MNQPESNEKSNIAQSTAQPAADWPALFLDREEHLRRFEALLQARQPAVVVVTGGAQMGKGQLLQEFGARAAQQGWKVIPSRTASAIYPPFAPDNGKLQIEPDTTAAQFYRQIEAMLYESAPESTSPDFEQERPYDLIDRLCEQAPLVLLIDHYRVNPEPAGFARWFSDDILTRLKDRSVAVIVAVEGREGNEISLPVDEWLEAGPLEKAPVRRAFEQLCSQLLPPLRPDELGRYVDKVSENPASWPSFARLFQLAQADVR